jgi:hypothetical protein
MIPPRMLTSVFGPSRDSELIDRHANSVDSNGYSLDVLCLLPAPECVCAADQSHTQSNGALLLSI